MSIKQTVEDSPKNLRPGFTLLEMMVVLLVLGIILATAVPAMNDSLRERRLDAAAEEVVMALEYAQNLAMTHQGTLYGVEFFPDRNAFRCYEDNGGAKTTMLHPVDKKPYEIDFDLIPPYRGVDLSHTSLGGSNLTSFDPFGNGSNTGKVFLELAKLKISVRVNIVTFYREEVN